jgi:glutamate synthase (ferredoxin)
MSSEAGVLDIEPANVVKHGRLEPGRMFLVNMDEGRIIEDEEIKTKVVSERPYQEWLDKNLLKLSEVPYTGNHVTVEPEKLRYPFKNFWIHSGRLQNLNSSNECSRKRSNWIYGNRYSFSGFI